MKHEPSERNDLVLDLIIKSYIDTAEPVGSRTLSKSSDLNLSAASIRNVMADLEDQGFLKQPHTSAGRVPTDQGYRYWVDSLMEPEALTAVEERHIQEEVLSSRTIDAMVERICRIISQYTGNAALVYLRNLKRVSLLDHLLDELVESQKIADLLEEHPGLFIDGTSRIFDQPEFQDIAKMRALLHAFDQKLAFLQAMMREPDDNAVHVRIGHENANGELEEVSLVTKDCHIGATPIGSIAVVGPTRMHYPKVVSVVDYVADIISDMVKRF